MGNMWTNTIAQLKSYLATKTGGWNNYLICYISATPLKALLLIKVTHHYNLLGKHTVTITHQALPMNFDEHSI